MTVAIAAACTMEIAPEAEPTQTAQEGSYVFTLNATAGDLATKTSYAGEQTFSWTAGDQISVLFHKGAENKFFTLTTASSGANVTFSGTIETGYEIGASDDASKKYALFPAGAHSYTPGSYPVFNIPSITDFSATHFSANLPMAANGDGSNNFAFSHMAGTYKFTFTDIDPSVTKVKLSVTNQLDYAISGNFQLKVADGDAQHLFRWSQVGSSDPAKKSLAYVANVVDGKASFYIPYSNDDWNEYSNFVPTLVLTNASNGYTLKSVSAKDKATFIGSSYERKSHYSRIVVFPDIPASGTGTAPAWASNHGINWDMVDAVVDGRSGSPYDGITHMKVTSDAANLYVFLEINPDELETNDTYAHANLASLYIGDGTTTGNTFWGWSTYYQTRIRGWLMTDGAVGYANYDGGFNIVDYATSVSGSTRYLEITYPRTGISALLGTSAYVGFTFDERYSTGGSATGDDTPHGYAPNTEFTPRPPMMHITLPAYSNPASASSPIDLSFTEASVDYLNPERGLYNQQSFHFRNSTIPSASLWDNDESLVLPLFYFEDFRTSDLSSEVLDRIEDIFDNIRAAHKKAIVRFGYINAHGEGDKPWDAGITQIRRHINQVKPILAANEDIIYVLQAGFVGVYGEWYYVSSDFDYSVNYSTAVSNRSLVAGDLLAAVPHRQVGMRGAKYKRQYLSPSDESSWSTISSWGTSDNQRLGFFNDGFRGDATDIGTFESDTDRSMWNSQSAWVVTGGETAYRGGETPESKNAWLEANPSMASFENAITAIQTQHFSYLNENPNNILMDYWGGAGGDVGTGESRIPELRKALGYRLVLNSANFTFSSLLSGSTINYSISLQNKGSAPVIYARPFKLVILHSGEATTVVNNLMDVRNLAPGASATVLSGSFDLPYSLSVGDKIAIWLPDADILDNGLDVIPEYSIRLANSDVTWSDGYNVLYTF